MKQHSMWLEERRLHGILESWNVPVPITLKSILPPAILYNVILIDAIPCNGSVISSYHAKRRLSRMKGRGRVRIQLQTKHDSKSFGSKQVRGILLTHLFSNENWPSAHDSPGIWPLLIVVFNGTKISSIFDKNCILFCEGEYPISLSSTLTLALPSHCHSIVVSNSSS